MQRLFIQPLEEESVNVSYSYRYDDEDITFSVVFDDGDEIDIAAFTPYGTILRIALDVDDAEVLYNLGFVIERVIDDFNDVELFVLTDHYGMDIEEVDLWEPGEEELEDEYEDEEWLEDEYEDEDEDEDEEWLEDEDEDEDDLY